MQPRIIRLPDPDRSFILETDASRVAVGAVLKQKFKDTGHEHPVGFFSKSLSKSERNYAAYELELYAMVRAVENFRMFQLGREFLLRTDHAALRNLLRQDLPPTNRVERWILRLSEDNFKIEHQKGQDNVIADVLFRLKFVSAQESCTPKSSGMSLDKWPIEINYLDSNHLGTVASSSSSMEDQPVFMIATSGELDRYDSDCSESDSEEDSNLSEEELVELKEDTILPRDYLPGAYNSVNAAVPLIDFPISRDG